MTSPAVLWPVLLGLGVLVAGIITHRRELSLITLGPVFVAASLAAFAGEHFTLAENLAQLVPAWLPGRLFISYFVGVAHLAAAVSFVARRYVRWSALSLAVMFALFVLLMDLPAAIRHPDVRMAWSLAARQATYAIGALALFATEIRSRSPSTTRSIATIARFWTAGVLVFYGFENLLYSQFLPGVPDRTPTPSWVPAPLIIAYATGAVLIVSGAMMLANRRALAGATLGGTWMLLLTAGLYVPMFFIAGNTNERVVGINFVFDTLLFGGTVLTVAGAMSDGVLQRAIVRGERRGSSDQADEVLALFPVDVDDR